jgi:hypothetical protein
MIKYFLDAVRDGIMLTMVTIGFLPSVIDYDNSAYS